MTLSLTGFKQYYFAVEYFADMFAFFLAFILATSYVGIYTLTYVRFFIIVFILLIYNYAHQGVYKVKRSLFGETELFALLKSYLLTFVFACLLVIAFELYYVELYFFGVFMLVFSFLLTVVFRIIISKILKFFRTRGYDRHRAFFFGNNEDLQHIIAKDNSLGYTMKGTTSSLAVLKKSLKNIDTVFILQELITDELLGLMITNTKITWKIIPSALNLVIEPVDFDEFKDYPIINLRRITQNKYNGLPKRIFDVIISTLALIILSPFFLLIAIIMKITMPGPVFFRHERLGKDLKPFGMYKFRSMVVEAESLKQSLSKKNEVKGLFKMKNDPRVTPFGYFLRRTSMDELPQLFNIFLGHMSLVGPRPHLQSELHNYKTWRKTRFSVKPGLTGLWQIKGRHELNFDKAVLYDIYYARNMSLALDMEIIMRTIPALIMNKGRF